MEIRASVLERGMRYQDGGAGPSLGEAGLKSAQRLCFQAWGYLWACLIVTGSEHQEWCSVSSRRTRRKGGFLLFLELCDQLFSYLLRSRSEGDGD